MVKYHFDYVKTLEKKVNSNYELLPAFIVALVAIIVVSLVTKKHLRKFSRNLM